MNCPVYVGFTMLELAKLLICMISTITISRKICRNKAQLLCIDTVSLTYHITTPDVTPDVPQDMKKKNYPFDTSDCPADDSLYSTDNKKVIGKFKDELSWPFI